MNPFVYRPPVPEQLPKYEAVSTKLGEAYDCILDHCPESAERTLAIRKLQEARMWANAAIALEGMRYPL